MLVLCRICAKRGDFLLHGDWQLLELLYPGILFCTQCVHERIDVDAALCEKMILVCFRLVCYV